MSLVVEEPDVATDDPFKFIEGLLKEICGKAKVDKTTGKLSLNDPAGQYSTGCDCLKKIIESKRTVTIHLLPGPEAMVPGANGQKIKHFEGGTTQGDTKETDKDKDGNAGKNKKDGEPGGDCSVYIDRSNNDKNGYSAPLWLILAHELTSGHASLNVEGKSAHTPADAEKEAIISENVHAKEHGMKKGRDPSDPSKTISLDDDKKDSKKAEAEQPSKDKPTDEKSKPKSGTDKDSKGD